MDVGVWLRNLGLGQYEATFRDNEIDGAVLPKLTVDDLKDLGVAVVGHRRKIMSAIEELNAASVARADAMKPPQMRAPPSVGASSDGAERRPITVMFCDLVGSTSLAAKLDAEDWRNLVNAYLDQASAAVTDFGGHVLKKLGDGLMALFGYPQAQENDAERAVRAALAIQRSLADLNARNTRTGAPELSARIGIECGSVVVDAAGEVFGDAPNVAARVQAAAEPGTVLVTAGVLRQTAGLFVVEEKGAHELKGVAQPVTLYRIVRASGGGRRGGARTLTPFVGREEELVLLARRWERARVGEGQLVLVVGEPGIGKSRLIEEFRAKLAETPHTWVEWAASQLLQNTPLHPLAEWGRLRFGGADATDEGRLADLENTLGLIGLDAAEYAPLLAPLVDVPLPEDRGSKFPPEELRRRQLTAMTAWVLAGARSQPAVIAFEDLHWADPTSLDLLRALAERGAQSPLLVVATTRPEFRAPWAMRSHHGVVSLAPLDRAQVRRMVGEIASRHALSDEMIDGVGERTGGVPLFVEEVTRLLLERDAQGGAQAIPPTLQQSLAARLDRLGEAREVAQIGAVLGRDFSYALLQAVAAVADPGSPRHAGLSEAGLQSALDRLAEADLLFADGAPPTAAYRFKHALIQDAAYDSLLKSRRQALHRRAAEALRNANAEPEAIAHHFTEAGLDDLAIEWWGKAGDQALRRSAFQEAIAHLGKGIAMADKVDGGTMRIAPNQRLDLRVAYGSALSAARGYSAPETSEAFAKAQESIGDGAGSPERLAIHYGLWASSLNRGDLTAMRDHAGAFLGEVGADSESPQAGIAHRIIGVTCWFAGDFLEARRHLERALLLFEPGRDDDLAFRFGQDAGVSVMINLATVSWSLGDVARSTSLVEEARARIADLTHVASVAFGRMQIGIFEVMRNEVARAAPNASALVHLAREHDLPLWSAFGEFLEGWAAEQDGAPGGLDKMRRGVERLHEQAVLWFDGLIERALAQAEARAGDTSRAIAILDGALETSARIDCRTFEADLHRTRGDILLRGPKRAAQAEEEFRRAIDIAHTQAARSFKLQAALSLAKLYQSTGRPVDAHAVLAPALEGFSPTPEMPEIEEAQALLVALHDIAEVKAAEAQRQRRTQLYVAYGNALIAARGFGAPETTEAFARARQSAFSERDAPERLAADFGLWAGSYTRGELPSMRAQAAAFLTDVEVRPDSPEAGVAHRVQGITHWFAGEFVEARDHLERALALFEPGRDDDLTYRFGMDPGVPAMAYLAFVLWSFGKIDCARSLAERMRERTAGLTHANTLALGTMHATAFELMRGDRPRIRTSALELAHIAREHDLRLFRAFDEFFGGWMAADDGALADGIERMRRGTESLRAQNALVFDGLLKIALSQAEARAGDPDRAVAILDEALATVDHTGYRAFEAELHRARGEILLERDPANTAPAEEAFQAGIAVAKQQGTRSFELRAAHSLAKMYQSTARPAEAHTVLAPALEGFSPTPEMPQIAEAQALLAALAATEEVKAAIAQRQRRLHLQTAYGQAMMWSKGYAAEETKAAFARAAELAGRSGDLSERLAALHGRWAAVFVAGELFSARELALALLREAEDAGRGSEAGVANRMLGLTAYFHGDFVAAQTYGERALDGPDTKRDANVGQGFSADSIVSLAYLAPTLWALGHIERARELINAATRRAAEIDVPALADALQWKVNLEILRDDPVATLSAAEALDVAARENAMAQWLSVAELAGGWARGRINDPAGGAAQVRHALARFADLGCRTNMAFFGGLLAELEAETLGATSGLACIDEALRVAVQTENRSALNFLHRIRGKILLRRDPADLVSAEEAFRTAIAIASEQSARSPALQASLALAKLYQSTGRLAEAHAVLAPALEGFVPTLEFPEIKEALELMTATEASAQL
jgi:class 3 adenylate cyclase/tetratricopeptide (TPR) repeat protein